MRCSCGDACSCLADFSEISEVADMVMTRIKESIRKHGTWDGYGEAECFAVIAGEFDEYREAVCRQQVPGAHGQIDELMDVAATAIKGIVRLSKI